MPNPIPVKLVHVAHEVVRCRTVEQDCCARVAFEFDIPEGARYFVAGRLQGYADVGRPLGVYVQLLCVFGM